MMITTDLKYKRKQAKKNRNKNIKNKNKKVMMMMMMMRGVRLEDGMKVLYVSAMTS